MSLTASMVVELRRRVRAGERIADLAREAGVAYTTLHSAVRGDTWSSVSDEAPLSVAEMRRIRFEQRRRLCANCGVENTDLQSSTLCNACYQYERRYGRPRIPALLWPERWRLSDAAIRALYRRYSDGESMEAIAADLPFSAFTLRRRFRDLGLPVRRRGAALVLNPAMVRQLRRLYYEDRVTVAELARRYDVGYKTVEMAVKWRTWLSAGGPGSEVMRVSLSDAVHKPCVRCGVLTVHDSGVCALCRAGE